MLIRIFKVRTYNRKCSMSEWSKGCDSILHGEKSCEIVQWNRVTRRNPTLVRTKKKEFRGAIFLDYNPISSRQSQSSSPPNRRIQNGRVGEATGVAVRGARVDEEPPTHGTARHQVVPAATPSHQTAPVEEVSARSGRVGVVRGAFEAYAAQAVVGEDVAYRHTKVDELLREDDAEARPLVEPHRCVDVSRERQRNDASEARSAKLVHEPSVQVFSRARRRRRGHPFLAPLFFFEQTRGARVTAC